MIGTGVFTSLGFQLLDIRSGFVLLTLWAIGGLIALCGAMTYAELAMYSNARFKAAVNNGKRPWEAAPLLGKGQTEAMFFLVTALQYEFKEGMGLASKIRNIDWMRNGLIFLDRIEEIVGNKPEPEPDWR